MGKIEGALFCAFYFGLGIWLVFRWFPRMIETAIYRAILKHEDIKRGGTGAGTNNDGDLGDVIITIQDEAKARKAERLRRAMRRASELEARLPQKP